MCHDAVGRPWSCIFFTKGYICGSNAYTLTPPYLCAASAASASERLAGMSTVVALGLPTMSHV
jgi:hypothetical protein